MRVGFLSDWDARGSKSHRGAATVAAGPRPGPEPESSRRVGVTVPGPAARLQAVPRRPLARQDSKSEPGPPPEGRASELLAVTVIICRSGGIGDGHVSDHESESESSCSCHGRSVALAQRPSVMPGPRPAATGTVTGSASHSDRDRDSDP